MPIRYFCDLCNNEVIGHNYAQGIQYPNNNTKQPYTGVSIVTITIGCSSTFGQQSYQCLCKECFLKEVQYAMDHGSVERT